MTEAAANPRVTVLMPVYNAQNFLREAIASILAQTYTAFEFLIIDDASTDGSPATVQSFTDPRIRFVRNDTNLGLIATLNKGFQLAKGAFVARMDQDDVSAPARLEKQYAAFVADRELLGIGTALTLINVNGERVGTIPVLVEYEQIRRAVAVTNPFTHSTMMLRRDAVLRAGGYSADAYAAEDYDLWARLSAVGRMANLDECLVSYRLNPVGMSISLQKEQKERAEQIMEWVWASFGDEGPAPLREWNRIWPRSGPAALAYLHRQFAEGYRKRGHWGLALRHFLASFGSRGANRGSLFTTLMFLMPYAVYSRLEERKTVFLKKTRAGYLDQGAVGSR